MGFKGAKITDEQTLKYMRALAEAAAPHIDMMVRTCVEVMADPKSRQRVQASALLGEWITLGALSGEAGQEQQVKVLVLESPQMDRVQERLRARNAVPAQLVPPGEGEHEP